MTRYRYVVELETDSLQHADQVMAERLFYDEQYEDDQGEPFDYQFQSWALVGFPPPDPADIVISGDEGRMIVHYGNGTTSIFLPEAFPAERAEALREGVIALRNRPR
jgi:hypothetical protein